MFGHDSSEQMQSTPVSPVKLGHGYSGHLAENKTI